MKNFKDYSFELIEREKEMCIAVIEDSMNEARVFCESFHGLSLLGGWWHDKHTGEPLTNRNVPEMLCLIHSEISEAMEGYRKDLMDDKLPHRKMLEVELADALIRICDTAYGLGLDVVGAAMEKARYNANREDHKLENRLKEGGKQF